MKTLYTAVGIFERRYDIKGNCHPVIVMGGQELTLDISEMVIWAALNWNILELPALEEQYYEQLAHAGLTDLPDCTAYMDRLLQRGLVVQGNGNSGHEALYDLLANLYIIPIASGYWKKLTAFFRMLYTSKLPWRVAKRVFAKNPVSEYEHKILEMTRKTPLSCAEVILCMERGCPDLRSGEDVMDALYLGSETNSYTIAAEAYMVNQEKPSLEAIANLYLRQLILFERT